MRSTIQNAFETVKHTFFFSKICMFCFQKERRLLENRRLDLDVCKARLKKAKSAEAKAAVRFIYTYSIIITYLMFIFMAPTTHLLS